MGNELELLKSRITCVRDKMHALILEKGNTLDPEIIEASQLLDDLLNEYYQLILFSSNYRGR